MAQFSPNNFEFIVLANTLPVIFISMRSQNKSCLGSWQTPVSSNAMSLIIFCKCHHTLLLCSDQRTKKSPCDQNQLFATDLQNCSNNKQGVTKYNVANFLFEYWFFNEITFLSIIVRMLFVITEYSQLIMIKRNYIWYLELLFMNWNLFFSIYRISCHLLHKVKTKSIRMSFNKRVIIMMYSTHRTKKVYSWKISIRICYLTRFELPAIRISIGNVKDWI